MAHASVREASIPQMQSIGNGPKMENRSNEMYVELRIHYPPNISLQRMKRSPLWSTTSITKYSPSLSNARMSGAPRTIDCAKKSSVKGLARRRWSLRLQSVVRGWPVGASRGRARQIG